MNAPMRRVLRWDPHLEPDEGDMEFHLYYEGPLLAENAGRNGAKRAQHKHEIRKRFHPQLKRLWEAQPTLVERKKPMGGEPSVHDNLAVNYADTVFRVVPLVNDYNSLICKLDILMLRPGKPGYVLDGGDIDNRLKTLFDALCKPRDIAGWGGAIPAADEDPFYVLLQDDRLITHVSVKADTLLETISTAYGADNAVRLVIAATIRTYRTHMDNLDFN